MELVDFEKYDEDFKWDMKLHFPIPTKTYILNRIGYDLSIKFNTDVEIQGFILSVARSARNYLYKDAIEYRRKLYEYYIAHNIDVIYNVLEYLLEFFQIAIIGGELTRIYELLDKKDKSKIIAIDNAIQYLGLNKLPYGINPLEFYKGY